MPDKVVQIAGDNADNFAARGENRIGESTHETHASAPVDEPNVSLCEFITKGVCGMAVRGVIALAGTAVDADPLHVTRLRQDGTARCRRRCIQSSAVRRRCARQAQALQNECETVFLRV